MRIDDCAYCKNKSVPVFQRPWTEWDDDEYCLECLTEYFGYDEEDIIDEENEKAGEKDAN